MTGKELKQIVKSSGKTGSQVAAILGITRAHLYNLYELQDIDPEYATMVENSELAKFDRSKKNDNSVSLSAQKLFEMWEKAEKERRNTAEAMTALVKEHVELMKTHNALVKSKLSAA